jgi:hypothetical protein
VAASKKETGRIDGIYLANDRNLLKMLPPKENSTSRKILLSLLALVLVICVIFGLLAISAGYLVIWG